jgi:SAM-dependent methyltransferase
MTHAAPRRTPCLAQPGRVRRRSPVPNRECPPRGGALRASCDVAEHPANAGDRGDSPDVDRALGFDRDSWEDRWADVLRNQPDQAAQRPPSSYLTDAVDGLAPGRALDAGCGHGTEALWLAARGWRVTAVDFAATALARGRERAAALGPEIADRIDWIEGDLARWDPEPRSFDLVSSLYVHVSGSVEEMVSRLGTGVAPEGMLLLVGHLPVDPVTGARTPAAGQVQVTVEAAAAALDARKWEMLVLEERPRSTPGTGSDAVISARRRA